MSRKKSRTESPDAKADSRVRHALPPPVCDESSPEKQAWRQEVFATGFGVGAESGWPAMNFVMKNAQPGFGPGIDQEMRLGEQRKEAEIAAASAFESIEFDPLDIEDPEAENLEWAREIVEHLPRDLYRQLANNVDRLVADHVLTQMVELSAQEVREFRGHIWRGVTTGFSLALARYKRPLMEHAPEARNLVGRLDAIQKNRQRQLDHLKRVRDADRVRLVKYGQSMMSKADRDAAICREFESLKATMPKVKDREEYLAEKAGFEDRKQVYNIRTKASGSKKK